MDIMCTDKIFRNLTWMLPISTWSLTTSILVKFSVFSSLCFVGRVHVFQPYVDGLIVYLVYISFGWSKEPSTSKLHAGLSIVTGGGMIR